MRGNLYGVWTLTTTHAREWGTRERVNGSHTSSLAYSHKFGVIWCAWILGTVPQPEWWYRHYSTRRQVLRAWDICALPRVISWVRRLEAALQVYSPACLARSAVFSTTNLISFQIHPPVLLDESIGSEESVPFGLSSADQPFTVSDPLRFPPSLFPGVESSIMRLPSPTAAAASRVLSFPTAGSPTPPSSGSRPHNLPMRPPTAVGLRLLDPDLDLKAQLWRPLRFRTACCS